MVVKHSIVMVVVVVGFLWKNNVIIGKCPLEEEEVVNPDD